MGGYVKKDSNPCKAGAIGIFKPEYYKEIEMYMKLGLTEKVVAEEIWEISTGTMDYWKRNNPKFMKCLKKGKENALAKVADALFRSAIGFEHPDTVILSGTEKFYDDEGKVISSRTIPIYVPTVKYYPPNAFAAQKILATRQRDIWADNLNINVNHSGSVNVQYLQQIENPEMITDNDLMLALNKGIELALQKENATANN